MRIYYYPIDEKEVVKNRVKEVIEKELRLKCGVGWKALDIFMCTLSHQDISWLTNEIFIESKKPWEKRYIAKLTNDVYEYRGKPSKQCTIRVYFSLFRDGVLMLLAESKTDDSDSIHKAIKRKKEVMGDK